MKSKWRRWDHSPFPAWGVDLLGVVTDARVSELCGVSPYKARKERTKRGILPVRGRLPRACEGLHAHRLYTCARTSRNVDIASRVRRGESLSTVGEDYGLTRERVRQIAFSRGVAPSTVKREKRLDFLQEFGDELGVAPDRDIARRSGLSSSTVGAIRERRGIPPVPSPSPNKDRVQAHRDLLGTMSDRQFALRFDIPPHAVRSYRNAWGIPPYTGKRTAQYKRKAPPDGYSSRGEYAYVLRANADAATLLHWRDVAKIGDWKCPQTAYSAARGYAIKYGKPWPLKNDGGVTRKQPSEVPP